MQVPDLAWRSISVKKTEPSHLCDAPDRLLDDGSRHFGNAFDTVGESDGDFLDFIAQLPRGKLHLDLEGISNETDFLEI